VKPDQLGWAPWLIVGLWVVWFISVLIHGSGVDLWPGNNPSFSSSGTFGDSFGSLASLMAALAAAGALLTLRQQQLQTSRQNFESNFFGLLDHFQSLAQATEAHNWGVEIAEDGTESEFLSHSFRGHQAFRAILDELRQDLKTRDFKYPDRVKKKYERFYESFQDDLGHYFRLLYHLFRMISERCEGSAAEKYYYAQLVRAHLSSAELILVAYNCICGEGRHKFVGYLKEFAVLHNVGFNSDAFGRAEMKFIQTLPAEAFVSPSQAAENQSLTATPGQA
jgi:hypothetical protein